MNHTRLLAQIKLRETERQRDRLQRQYDAIEARVAQADSPLGRLRALHDGLRAVTFAQKPLHPDVRELDALYLADELGVVPPELVIDRTRFLERELAQGRLRAEFTYAFGRILSEWVGGEGGAAACPDRPADPFAVLWADPPALDRDWLAGVFEQNRGVLQPIAAKVAAFARAEALGPATQDEVLAILRQLSRDRYLRPTLRRHAAEALASPTQVTELAGVLTILLNSLDEWDWPADGVPLRAVWVRVKDRPYLDEDLITALFLQLVGLRWGARLRALLKWQALRDGRDPLFRPEPATAPTALIAQDRLRQQADRFLATVPPNFPYGSGQDVGYSAPAQTDFIETIERELRFARAAFPDRPCYVVQADLRDFYPSLPHALVLDVLRRLGVPDRWLAFFQKFLAAPARQADSRAAPLRGGVVLEHVLSDVLAEVVLWLLDLHVYRATGLVLLRLVDDFWFLADSHDRARAGWQAAQDFCRACGLAVNDDKSGAVCVGDRPGPTDGLPAGRPRWGLLRLQPAGHWDADEPALARLEETIRQELTTSPSVLALVARYNGYLRYVLQQLALSVPLRGEHLRRVGQRVQRLHDGLFGPGHGVVEEVGRRVRECFADARLKERGLPHALLYWPITAGGLALAHPVLHVAAYVRGRKGWAEPRPPDREVVTAYLWRRKEDVRENPLTSSEQAQLGGLDVDRPNPYLTRAQLEEYQRAAAAGAAGLPDRAEVDVALAALWFHYYTQAVSPIAPSSPPPLPTMERLVQDFISRGSEVSGHLQTGLSVYWRWVIYTYGPSLLDALGTFRFLLTELVPLQLILENRGLASAPADTTPGPDSPEQDPDPGSEIPF